MDERVWVVIRALTGDHGIQLVHHGQQQLQLVSRLLQVYEHKLAQHRLSNLQSSSNLGAQAKDAQHDEAVAAAWNKTWWLHKGIAQ